jgi:hypothetical protein
MSIFSLHRDRIKEITIIFREKIMPLPAPETIKASIDDLVSKYKNTTRQDTIKLLEQLNSLTGDPSEISKIKLGALIWIEKDIKYREYKGSDPLYYYYINKYSTLYYNLNQHLPNLTSAMTKHDKLVCLVRFYKFMETHDLSAFNIATLDAIKNSIPLTLSIELKEQEESVDKLLRRMPAPRYFLKSFSQIKEGYDTHYAKLGLVQRYMHEPDRDQMARFIDVINKRLNKEDAASPSASIKRDSVSYLTRYGAAILILNEIDKTYQFMWGSGRSQLYTLCCNATKLSHPADLSANETFGCYSNLSNFINNELKSKNFKEDWAGLLDAENYLKAINLRLFMHMFNIMHTGTAGKKLTYDERFKRTVGYATKLAASYAAGMTVGALFTELSKKTIGATAVYFAGPAAGGVITLLGYAGDYMANSYLPNKISEQVGEKVGSVVMTATLSELSAVQADEKQSSFNYPEPKRHEDIHEEDIWIQSLLDLPDSVFSRDKKQTIEELFDPDDYDDDDDDDEAEQVKDEKADASKKLSTPVKSKTVEQAPSSAPVATMNNNQATTEGRKNKLDELMDSKLIGISQSMFAEPVKTSAAAKEQAASAIHTP